MVGSPTYGVIGPMWIGIYASTLYREPATVVLTSSDRNLPAVSAGSQSFDGSLRLGSALGMPDRLHRAGRGAGHRRLDQDAIKVMSEPGDEGVGADLRRDLICSSQCLGRHRVGLRHRRSIDTATSGRCAMNLMRVPFDLSEP